MTDPIQPVGEWCVLSPDEIEKLAPFFRSRYVTELTDYLASVDQYMPRQPRRTAKVPSDTQDQIAAAWDEGYRQAARDELIDGEYGIAPWQLEQNPYRSES